MNIDPTVAYGLSASAVVILAVQVAKFLNAPERFWPWIALLASIVVVALFMSARLFPVAIDLLNSLVLVLSVFMVATGGYHTVKNAAVAVGIVSTPTK